MTLTTYVALHGPIDADTAFVLALQALLTAGGQADRFDSTRSRTASRNGRTILHTVPDPGLPGITQAEAEEDGTQLDLNATALAGWDLAEQMCNALVSWESRLGYSGPVWGNVEHLHAAAVILLGHAVPDGVEMRWRNDFTSTWHHSVSGLQKLTGSVLSSMALAREIRATHGLTPHA